MKKIFIKLSLSILLLFSLVACGGGGGNETSKGADGSSETLDTSEASTSDQSGVFTVAIDYMPESLQSSLGSDSITIMTRPIYDPLYQETSTGDIDYRLADSLEISDDGLTYSIHIDDKATWSDGEPITTDDVLFSLEYVMETNGGISHYTHVNDVPIEFNVIDDKTMDFILPEPKNNYIVYLSNLDMLPAHPFDGDWSKVDGSGYFMQAGMATSGAYEVVEVNEDSFVYKARDDYYRGTPNFETIVMKVLGSGSTRNVAFENGEISYARVLSGEQLEKYKAEADKYNVYSISENRVNSININPNSPIEDELSDPYKARQAIFMALDQEEIIMGAYGSPDLANPANSLAHPDMILYNPDNKGYEQNIEEAKKLAEESGLAGKTLRYVYNRDRAHMEEIAIVVQQQLGQIGVEVVVEGLDNAGFWSRYTPGELENQTWELATNGWDTMRGNSLSQFIGWATIPERWGWSDEVVDLAIETNSEPDPEKEEKLAHELQEKTIEECWFYPLPYPQFVCVSHKNITGLDASEIVPEFGDYLEINVE